VKALCQLILLVLLAALVLTVLGAALFIGVGALLSQWLPLSLFQASALAVGATMAIALVVQVVTTTMHLQMEHTIQDDDSGWEPVDKDNNHTTTPTPNVLKVGRNETCPCASGKKFKNCCGKSTAP
jgi:uncharacterized protein YchJ